jgi:NAD dependent epimerase/dehydratase family
MKTGRGEHRRVGAVIVEDFVRRDANAGIACHVYAGYVVSCGMNEIMITGSTGVIGRRAVRELLAADYRVTDVTRSARGRERLGEKQPVDHGTNAEEVGARPARERVRVIEFAGTSHAPGDQTVVSCSEHWG